MVKIDGVIFKRMIISGANNLYNTYPEIDNLNVFPVPDGDTGTNMNLTMSSGVQEVFNKTESSLSKVASDFALGLFSSGRGNSGVILSAIFKGFAEALKGKDSTDALGFADAFVMGRKVAYNSVITPVEGTILTVAREAAEYAKSKVTKKSTIEEFFAFLIEEAKASLERTPELLPVLKEAGVIDSGGAGYIYVIEGMAKALDGEIIKAARKNAFEAGVDKLIHFQQRPVCELNHPKKYGFIITNPPYGERLEEKEALPDLYGQIGEAFSRLDSWSMYLITSYDNTEKYIGKKADKNRKVYN